MKERVNHSRDQHDTLMRLVCKQGLQDGCAGWRQGRDSNPCMEVLQTSALPLGYPAEVSSQKKKKGLAARKLERETGFEPATSTLARLRSTN